MELILILFGCVAMIIFGLILAGAGAMGESVPAYFTGLGVSATGIGFAVKHIFEALGVNFSSIDFSITISNGFISLIACVIIGIVGVIAIWKIILR